MSETRLVQRIGASPAHRFDTENPTALTGGISCAPNTKDVVSRVGLMGVF